MDPRTNAGSIGDSPTHVVVETVLEPRPETQESPVQGLLQEVLNNTPTAAPRPHAELQQFLNEPSLEKALAFWVDRSAGTRPKTKRQLQQLLVRDIARL